MGGIKIQEGKNFEIKNERIVKVTKYNNATNNIDITAMSHAENVLKRYRKKSNSEYLDTQTGEIIEYEKREYKTKKGISRSMNKVKKYIKNNFTGAPNELFITLTLSSNIQDKNEIKSYFNRFWKKLKYRYEGLEYIYVIEIQEERECPHLHLLIKDLKNEHLYIKNETIQSLWGQGITKTSRISKTNIHHTINESEQMQRTEHLFMPQQIIGIEGVTSYMTKSKSKEMLPNGMKIYSKSKGIIAPLTEKMKYQNIKDVLDDNYYKSSEYTTLIISNNTNTILNSIKKEEWKPKKNNKEEL